MYTAPGFIIRDRTFDGSVGRLREFWMPELLVSSIDIDHVKWCIDENERNVQCTVEVLDDSISS